MKRILLVVAILGGGLAACSADPSTAWTGQNDGSGGPDGGNPISGDEGGGGTVAAESGPPLTMDGSAPVKEDGTTDAGVVVVPPPKCNVAAMARGAAVPYQEYEAENGMTNGMVLGPSRAVNDGNVFNSIAGESSGRKAVKLSASGQYVRFTNACVANSVVVRYVIPDSADGSGITSTLGLYVNGVRVQSLALTSHYAWAYGNPNNSDATTNNPGDGYARHFYDEARVLLTQDIPVGATVSLQQDASDTAAYYVVDLIDLEEVPPPLAQPANSLSIATCGATPNDTSDDGVAIQKCIDTAQTRGVDLWIPPGTYIDQLTALNTQNVKIDGAGMWYSTIRGASSYFVCGTGCQYSNFSILGEITLRDDAHSVHAMGGSFGTGSRIENVWMEHFTTGPWIGIGGATPSNGLVVHGSRFRNLFADGINLSYGTSNAVVEQTNARNTGDDAFASWAIGTAPPNTSNVFRFDTAQVPWRANCFAIYGGTGNAVQDSVCADTVTYPGIMVDQDFASNAFGGTTPITRDTILRSGGGMYGAKWGALTVRGGQGSSPIVGVQVQDVAIDDATFSGILISGPKDPISGMTLDAVTIANPGTFGIDVDPSAFGSANATNVVVTSPGSGMGLNNAALGSWTFARGAGNTGW